jgi:thiol-disulfide isomerase/thioredoxin
MIHNGSTAGPRRSMPLSSGLAILLAFVLAVSAACTTRTPIKTEVVPPPAVAAKPAPPPVTPSPATPPPTAAAPGAATATAPSPGAPAPARPPAPPPLLGTVTREDLKSYASWKDLFTTGYTPDPAAVAAIKANAKDVTVVLVLATWCPDSKRELPRYFAIMDAAGIGDTTLTSVGVDRSKKDAGGLTEKWGITRVPTFVFLRNGQEIGRFVERVPPGSTLEAEIARILSVK